MTKRPAGPTRERMYARVTGRVQGVGFRYWTLREANGLGLVGWVANGDDERSVQLVAEGAPEALDMLERLLGSGPAAARVERVDVRREPAQGGLARFEIARS
jgi:acylphosphatase